MQSNAVGLAANLHQVFSGHAQHVGARKTGEHVQILLETVDRQPARRFVWTGELSELIGVVRLKSIHY